MIELAFYTNIFVKRIPFIFSSNNRRPKFSKPNESRRIIIAATKAIFKDLVPMSYDHFNATSNTFFSTLINYQLSVYHHLQKLKSYIKYI